MAAMTAAILSDCAADSCWPLNMNNGHEHDDNNEDENHDDDLDDDALH